MSRVTTSLGLVAFALALGVGGGAIGCKAKGTKNPELQQRVESERKQAIESVRERAKQETLVDLANADLGRGRYVSAANLAEEALADNPDNADAFAVLGAARWRAGDFAASTQAYEKALAIDAKHFGAALGLARNRRAAGDHERSLKLQATLLADDPTQLEPMLAKLWSQYALLRADDAAKTLDDIFSVMPADHPLVPLVQSFAAFVRPLSGRDLCVVKGAVGEMDAGVNHDYAVKFTSAIASEEFTRVVISEGREEAQIDPSLAEALGLEAVGTMLPVGAEQESEIVIVPSLKFGDLELTQVPALVTDLGIYKPALGETPGVVLGRQALLALGSFTFDFPNNTFTVTNAPPTPSAQFVEAPLLLVSMHVAHAPVVPMRIDDAEHRIYAYFGGFERSSVAMTRKAYLKSGHLPRELVGLDDEELGLKMVLVDDLAVGGRSLGGFGGLVMVNDPPDATLDAFLQSTGFEIGGYINTRVMASWVVTYDLQRGKVFIKSGA